MKKEGKKGLSMVITVVLLILLVLIAVAVIWVVVKNLVSETEEDIEIGRSVINLKITQVYFDASGLNVQVKRDIGKGELSGLKFVISDGTDSQSIEQDIADLDELDKKTFTINYDGLVKEISVAPIIKISESKTRLGGVSATKKLTNEETIKTAGAISWWKLEGSGGDEIGNNVGTLYGNINCNVQGKFRKACDFDGDNTYIKILDTDNLDTNYEFSLVAWIYPLSYVDNDNYQGIIISKWYSSTGNAKGDYIVWFEPGGTGKMVLTVANNDTGSGFQADVLDSSSIIPLNQWTHVIATFNNSEMKIYINGSLDANKTSTNVDHTETTEYGTDDVYIGTLHNNYYNFNGTIDEVMIFNRALSANEVKGLYNLEL